MNRKSKKERILILRFKNKIRQDEISFLRGAINELLKENSHVLFHNHEGDTFRIAYPLIQYKRINHSASIVCINEGTEVVGLLLSLGCFKCKLGNIETELEINSVKANQFLIQTWDSSFTYRIRKWLPLNHDNYNEYLRLEGLAERAEFLERILIGNILSFGKGVGVHFDNQISCKILQIDDPKLMKYKAVKLMSFDIEFKSNVSIPNYIGLGKGTSIGFGMITRKYEQ